MNNGQKRISFLRKICITIFYTAILAFCLYFPKIKELFYSENSINVYTFAGVFAPDMIEKFEKQYGVKVNIQFFESNEELLAKLNINRGRGYDVITPSDYMVEFLIKDSLLLKLDHEKIAHFKDLDPRICSCFFDPKNEYSLPVGWILQGVLFNKKVFKIAPEKVGLEFLFEDPANFPEVANFPYKICMKDDGRDATLLAALYLYGSIGRESFTPERLATIKELLIKQKRWVENYLSQDIGYFFVADVVPVAITDSSYAAKIMEESDDFDFVIPYQGSFISIENVAIPKTSTKIDLAYKFVNFALTTESSTINMNEYGLNPSNMMAYEKVPKKFFNNTQIFPDKEAFKKLFIIHNDLPLKEIEKVWLEVKGA